MKACLLCLFVMDFPQNKCYSQLMERKDRFCEVALLIHILHTKERKNKENKKEM